MSLFIASLNSGSNGNAYYVGTDQEAVLIDAGISCKEIEKRMSRLNLSMHRLKAIFVSHEHHDHIRGLPVLSKKYQLPVYITQRTLAHGSLTLENHLVRYFHPDMEVEIGNLKITAFLKCHDAIDPHSFTVKSKGVCVGVFTDIGVPCDQLVSNFKKCHAAFLEANYDEDMLERGRYPYHLKRRIRGGNGHLSNRQALELFSRFKPDYMSHLLLAHLSKDNNCPVLVRELFEHHAGDTQVIVASRDEESQVYKISQAGELIPPSTKSFQPTYQYSLFQ